MIDVNLWEIVSDWMIPRFKHMHVIQFATNESITHDAVARLGRIVFDSSDDEVGFIASKGILIWSPEGIQKGYKIIQANDPEMFEKLEKLLREYESKRSK